MPDTHLHPPVTPALPAPSHSREVSATRSFPSSRQTDLDATRIRFDAELTRVTGCKSSDQYGDVGYEARHAAAKRIIQGAGVFDYDRALALAEQLDLIPAMDETDDLLFDLAWTFDESVSGFAADFRAGVERAGQSVIEEAGWWPRNAWDEMPASLRRGVERAEDEFVQDWLGRFQHFMETPEKLEVVS